LVALVSLAISVFALQRARLLVQAAERRAEAGRRVSEAAVRDMHQAVLDLSDRLGSLREQPVAAEAPSPPKSGFNLNKRSQALRMHGRGDSPEQIVTVLELPRQELELLLKIQRIVAAA
jgi:hypothetical protein